VAKVYITGIAGFIGYHLAMHFSSHGHQVVGLDNFNDYYNPSLKRDRIQNLKSKYSKIQIYEADLCDDTVTKSLLEEKPDVVVHLAAQAGVRYSLENPWAYINSNIVGFQKVLEAVKLLRPSHFITASSSSVYGSNTKMPYSVTDPVDHPVSLYAVTKRSNELTAQVYAETFDLPITALRFFTVYGSWGRPDMAYFSFTNKILKGDPIQVFNNGQLKRDFTHISDIAESILRLLSLPPERSQRFRLLNIGASSPVPLLEFIETLETVIGKKATKDFKSMQPGDVLATYADVDDLEKLTAYKPSVNLLKGLSEFYEWYKSYYQ
jgi:UDP-glucuronate 4-epimerase